MNKEAMTITEEEMTYHQKRMRKIAEATGITTLEAERNFKEAHQKYKEALEAIGRKTE